MLSFLSIDSIYSERVPWLVVLRATGREPVVKGQTGNVCQV